MLEVEGKFALEQEYSLRIYYKHLQSKKNTVFQDHK